MTPALFYRQPWQKMGQEKGNKAADDPAQPRRGGARAISPPIA
jgi:hypothetical protein